MTRRRLLTEATGYADLLPEAVRRALVARFDDGYLKVDQAEGRVGVQGGLVTRVDRRSSGVEGELRRLAVAQQCERVRLGLDRGPGRCCQRGERLHGHGQALARPL